MSSIYTPRPAYPDLGGVVVLLSITKRFPTFLQCDALLFAPAADLSPVQLVAGALEFRDAVSTLPVNAILGPIFDGKPLTLYLAKPGFEEDFREVAGDITVAGFSLVRAAPDPENPFLLIFGPAEPALPAEAVVVPAVPQAEAPSDMAEPVAPLQPAPLTPAAAEAPPAMAPALPAAPAKAEPAAPAEPVVVPAAVEAEVPAPVSAPVAAPTNVAVAVPVVAPAATAVEAPVLPAAVGPAAATGEAMRAEAVVVPVSGAARAADADYAELRNRLMAQAQAQAQALAQTQALVQTLAQSGRQDAAQIRQDMDRLLGGQQAALLEAVNAKLAQMQDQAANRQLSVARQVQDEQSERQLAALRTLQQEQATQLQALLVKLQNEQSEWQQETFRTLQRAQQAQQQAQAERPAWFSMGLKELTRALAEQGESLQSALKAQQDQFTNLQRIISEWRSQKPARAETPVLEPELGLAVSELTWKVEKGESRMKSMSARLNLLCLLTLLLLAALGIGFVWSTASNGAALAALRPPPTPTYNEGQTATPPFAVTPEPTVPLTGITLKCAEAALGRGYYDCVIGNGVAYPQTLSLAIAADGGQTHNFFPSVTLGESQVFPDVTTKLASLGPFEIGEQKHFRLNLPCAAALGCAPTTFVVQVLDSRASVVPGSELLITSAAPGP